MPSFLLAILTLLAAVACADDDGITTSPEQDVPQWATNNALQLNLSTPGGQSSPLQYTVIPLTPNVGLNESQRSRGNNRIDGIMIAADISNYNRIASLNVVVYLSCDPPQADSFITPNQMLNSLMNANPKAIVLYSQSNNWCSLGNTDSILYTSILSMADGAEATQALSYLNGTAEGRIVNVSITGNATAGDPSSNSGLGGSNSTVAMSILYSITGLITLLFLIIIATGAVRAHRYPERYGPRGAIGGRPRQSRAKGLARAVLDTIPIVKFNNQEPAKPDPELELETATTDGQDVGTQRTASHVAESEAVVVAGGNGNDTPTPATEAQKATEPSNSGKGNAGCSICTEDFKVGEDMRVLPCHHQFHPNCIDPWLINVSGTCPLCRLDLRPEAARTNDALTAERGSTLPPPLALAAEDGVGASASHRHRISRFLDVNRLRQATAEEQIEALRQMRSSGAEPEGQEADREERGQRAHLSAKLKEKFRIRTRARSPESRDG